MSVREKMSRRECVFGTWVSLSRNPKSIRMIADAGFDFVYIDMEHASLSWETVADFCEMADACGLTPIVRASELSRAGSYRLLEIGARGIMFHDVDSRDEVEEILDWVRKPKDLHGEVEAEGGPFVVVQIETVAGLEAVDEILTGGGIDVIEIGRGDLAKDMGLTREHPDVLAALDRIFQACEAHGVEAGITCISSGAYMEDLVERGFRWLSYSGDAAILANGYREGIRDLRELTAARGSVVTT